MVDFSKAEQSKNHKNSFEKAIQSLTTYLDDLKNKYDEEWKNIEALRKERASLIDELTKIIKENKISIETPLIRCNHEMIMSQMNEIIPTLNDELKEIIKPKVDRIDELYQEITLEAPKLDKIFLDLSEIRLKEADHDDEVIFVPKSKKKKEQSGEKETKYPSIINDNDMKFNNSTIEKDTNMSNHLAEEIESILNSDVPPVIQKEDIIKIDEPNAENISYNLGKGITFIEITENIYGNADLWQDLYRYESNKEIIDKKAKEYGVDVETAVHSPKILENVTLLLPTELTYVEKNQTD